MTCPNEYPLSCHHSTAALTSDRLNTEVVQMTTVGFTLQAPALTGLLLDAVSPANISLVGLLVVDASDKVGKVVTMEKIATNKILKVWLKSFT